MDKRKIYSMGITLGMILILLSVLLFNGEGAIVILIIVILCGVALSEEKRKEGINENKRRFDEKENPKN